VTGTFLIKDKHKNEQKTNFKPRYIHALAKSTMAEGIKLPSMSDRV